MLDNFSDIWENYIQIVKMIYPNERMFRFKKGLANMKLLIGNVRITYITLWAFFFITLSIFY